jgi:hypothetical protein
MGVGVVSGAAICLAVMTNTAGVVAVTGSIAPPPPAVAALPVVLVLVVALAGWSAASARAFVPFLTASVVALGIVVYAVAAQPAGLAWNYYPSKVAWIWATVAFPFLLVPFAQPRGGPAPRSTLGAVAVLLAAIALSPVATPVLPSAMAWTQTGLEQQGYSVGAWEQPDAAALRLVERLGSTRQKYVVYGVDPEEDRITNFWLATYDPFENNKFIAWAYFEQNRPEDICTILDQQPRRIVATADPTAEQALEATCGRDVRTERVRP